MNAIGRLCSAIAFGLFAAVAGCGVTYHDPQPPESAVTQAVATPPALGVEQAYRVLYARLDECFASGYHLQPRFFRQQRRAELLLVSGLGLDRYSVLGNRLVARVDIAQAPPGQGAQAVTRLTLASEELRILEQRLPAWLAGDTRCRG